MNRRHFFETVAALLACTPADGSESPQIHLKENQLDIDYAAYLSGHDLVYRSPAEDGWEGLPLGNGDLGGMLWNPGGDLLWTLNKCDTWDDHPGFEPGNQTDLVSCAALRLRSLPVFDWLYLQQFEGRLSLHDATVRLHATTPFGETRVEAFCSSASKTFCLHLNDSLTEPVTREFELSRFGSRSLDLLITKPGTYSGDAAQRVGDTDAGADPEGIWITQKLARISFAVYLSTDGGETHPHREHSHAAVIRSLPIQKADITMYASIVTSEEAADPLAAARANVFNAKQQGWQKLHAEHARQWAAFWQKSFVHLPNDYVENLWYLFFYQLNSCSRGRYAPLFSGGLWLWNHDVRQWGGRYYHWNEQGVYWPVHAANHAELAEPYYRTYFPMLDGARAAARRAHNVEGAFFSDIANRSGEQLYKGESVTCNLTPAMQIALDFWRHYQYTGNETFLRERALPFLEGSVRFYLALLRKTPDGTYFLPSSCAYETPLAGDEKRLRNATPDLATIRAGFRAFIQATGGNGDLAHQCQDVLGHFPHFATFSDPTRGGEVFGRGTLPSGKVATDPVFRPDQSPVFPAGEVGLDHRNSPDFPIAVRTWRAGVRGELGIWPESVVAARLGLATQANEELEFRVDQLQIFPQGFFTDMGMRTLRFYAHNQAEGPPIRGWDARPITKGVRPEPRPLPMRPITQPFLESAGIFATTIEEMLLQSYSGRIRVFPSVPANWTASFTLRAVGGFLITSECEAGQVLYVSVESLQGGRCTIVNPWTRPYHLQTDSGTKVHTGKGEEVVFETEKSRKYLLEPSDRPISSYRRARFERTPNQAPKTLGNAILGRIRNF